MDNGKDFCGFGFGHNYANLAKTHIHTYKYGIFVDIDIGTVLAI